MRRFLTALFRRFLKVFFQRIEVAGIEKVPVDRPLIYAVNHPNGLLDPLFILCFAPGRVSFLAKAPLLKMPLVGFFVRAFDSIPVYRKQDNSSGTNRETFARAREVLRSGGNIAIFPEGTTHSDPRLRELKTGAARIALGAASSSMPVAPMIVPAGIYYTEKQTFRSKALIYFGDALTVQQVEVDEEGEPPVEAVRTLTSTIENALSRLTLQADSHAALQLIVRAEDIFFKNARQPLAEELELRRRFVQGYHYLRWHDPRRLEMLESRIRRFEAELGARRLEAHELMPRFQFTTIVRLLFLLPLAAAGTLLHFPVYRLVDLLSRRIFQGASEMAATVKFISALAFYPLMWIVVAVVAGSYFGYWSGLAALFAIPLLGFIALRVVEDLDDVIGHLRGLFHRIFSGEAHAQLLFERRAIRRNIIDLGDEIEASTRQVLTAERSAGLH